LLLLFIFALMIKVLFPLKHYLFFLLVILCIGNIYADNHWQDSVVKILPGLNDTAKVDALNKLADSFSDTDLKRSKQYAMDALHLADSISYAKGRIVARDNVGYTFLLSAQYEKAVSIYKEAINITKNAKLPKRLTWLYNRLAAAYYYLGDYQNALQNYLETSNYALKYNDKYTLFNADLGMANIYLAKNDYVNTEKRYKESQDIARELNDVNSIALIENNLGVMYLNQKKYDESLKHYVEGLDLYRKVKDSASVALSLVNIGGCYSNMGNFTRAIDYYSQALEVYDRIKDQNGLILCYINISSTYSSQKNYAMAIDYLSKGLQKAKQINRKELEKKCYEGLADMYNKTGKYKEAYDYYKLYSEIKDTLLNETNTKSINELQTKYDTEKKDIENKRISLENENQANKIKQDSMVMNFLIALSLLGLIITFVIYNQYRQKQKANRELEEKNTAIRKQKREIENQKLIVENQNKEITDSINYARQIQQAILPSDLLISKVLPDHFILYKPKAIVSGDFYFFAEKSDRIFIAAVDCTGHGVPGAFMSMIGHNLLNQIINEKGISEPAEILNQLNKGVRTVLQQDSERSENRDGMDIAFMAIHKSMKTVEYAGANRPLYLIRNGVITETKGDKFPIGGLQYEGERTFTNKTVEVQDGDSLYMFSDGYADQFGGEKGKKFMVKNLQNTLLQIQSKPIHDQKNILDTTIEMWRGSLEQIDDILVIGVQV